MNYWPVLTLSSSNASRPFVNCFVKCFCVRTGRRFVPSRAAHGTIFCRAMISLRFAAYFAQSAESSMRMTRVTSSRPRAPVVSFSSRSLV